MDNDTINAALKAESKSGRPMNGIEHGLMAMGQRDPSGDCGSMAAQKAPRHLIQFYETRHKATRTLVATASEEDIKTVLFQILDGFTEDTVPDTVMVESLAGCIGNLMAGASTTLLAGPENDGYREAQTVQFEWARVDLGLITHEKTLVITARTEIRVTLPEF